MKTETTETEVILQENVYSEVQLNQSYLHLLAQDTSQETKHYIEEKLQKAQWLQQCITQRKTTILRVVQEVVKRQEAFFIYGPKELKALRMADVAKTLQIHESTVSRAVYGKYIQCRWGTYALRSFFVRAIPGNQQEQNAQRIQQTMKEIVNAENKTQPLSDQKIADALLEKGYNISRRTVAKYRNILEIPDAAGRKWQK